MRYGREGERQFDGCEGLGMQVRQDLSLILVVVGSREMNTIETSSSKGKWLFADRRSLRRNVVKRPFFFGVT